MQVGHRSVPRDTDARIEAWAPTREGCVAEAVVAMVETFADIRAARPSDVATFEVPTEDTDEDLLVTVLGEVLCLLDTADVVPIRADLEPIEEGYDVRFEVVEIDRLALVGAIPSGVSARGLTFEPDGDGWTCRVTLDV